MKPNYKKINTEFKSLSREIHRYLRRLRELGSLVRSISVKTNECGMTSIISVRFRKPAAETMQLRHGCMCGITSSRNCPVHGNGPEQDEEANEAQQTKEEV